MAYPGVRRRRGCGGGGDGKGVGCLGRVRWSPVLVGGAGALAGGFAGCWVQGRVLIALCVHCVVLSVRVGGGLPRGKRREEGRRARAVEGGGGENAGACRGVMKCEHYARGLPRLWWVVACANFSTFRLFDLLGSRKVGDLAGRCGCERV